MTAKKLNRRQSRAKDPALPQRVPFIHPPAIYSGAPADVVELFADALRAWSTSEPPCIDQRDQGF